MVSNRQRQRQLARARYERQQARRQTKAKRQRLVSIVVGTLIGLIVLAALGWLILRIVDQEKQREQPVPTPSPTFSTDLLTPSSNVPSTPTATETSR